MRNRPIVVALALVVLAACGSDTPTPVPLPPLPSPISEANFQRLVVAYTRPDYDPTLSVSDQLNAIDPAWNVSSETVESVLGGICDHSLTAGFMLRLKLPGGDLRALPAMANLLAEAQRRCLLLTPELDGLRGDIVYHLSRDPLEGLAGLPAAHQEMCDALSLGERGINAVLDEVIDVASEHGATGGLVLDLTVSAAIAACPLFIDEAIRIVEGG